MDEALWVLLYIKLIRTCLKGLLQQVKTGRGHQTSSSGRAAVSESHEQG